MIYLTSTNRIILNLICSGVDLYLVQKIIKKLNSLLENQENIKIIRNKLENTKIKGTQLSVMKASTIVFGIVYLGTSINASTRPTAYFSLLMGRAILKIRLKKVPELSEASDLFILHSPCSQSGDFLDPQKKNLLAFFPSEKLLEIRNTHFHTSFKELINKIYNALSEKVLYGLDPSLNRTQKRILLGNNKALTKQLACFQNLHYMNENDFFLFLFGTSSQSTTTKTFIEQDLAQKFLIEIFYYYIHSPAANGTLPKRLMDSTSLPSILIKK